MSGIQNSSKNQEEIDKLYREYKGCLMQFVKASVEDKSVAEDIVHETFFEAMRKYDEVLKDHPNQVVWLYKTAKYKIMEYQRKLNARDEVDIEELAETASSHEAGFDKVEMEMLMYEQLSSDELLRFRRYYLWGESTEELAEKEKTTENNIRVKLSRLKQKIKKILSQE